MPVLSWFKCSPTNFHNHQWILSATVLTEVFASRWLFKIYFLLHLLIRNLLWKRAILTPALTFAFDYFYQYGLMNIYFILWIKILSFFLTQIVWAWASYQMLLYVGSYVLSTSPHFSIEHFPIFWNHKVIQAHCLFSLPQPWNQLLLQDALVHFTGERYTANKIWVLGVHIASKPS